MVRLKAYVLRFLHCLIRFHRPVNAYSDEGDGGWVWRLEEISCECGKVFWRRSQ